ncbi:hypothetical protein [Bacteroides eggerthii]|uniref:Transposase n=1 Tax=Bacteroides eggerthii TaxID=28111 RepID=A0A7X9XJV2_9BACE|nr:hypothetical protein [Bacteroides eggerthii]NME88052.1 hypothetical protein [Bacteroides eggerthii]
MSKYKRLPESQCLDYLEEYMSSPVSRYRFEKEKGLTRNTIYRWLRKFGVEDKTTELKPAVMEKELPRNEQELQERIRLLEQEVKSLKVKLRNSNMARDAYNYMIDLAEETYNIKVRKNSDAK